MGLLNEARKHKQDQSITLITNIFKPVSSRVQKKGHWKTLGQAFYAVYGDFSHGDSGNNTVIPFDKFSFVVNGETADNEGFPLTDDCIINGYVIPANNQTDVGVGAKIGGYALIIAGIAIGIASEGTLSPISAALIGSGVSMIFAGSTLIWGLNVPEFEDPKVTQKPPNMRGGVNRVNIGGSTPIILGRHRFSPDFAGEYFDMIPDPSATEIFAGRKYDYTWNPFDSTTRESGQLQITTEDVYVSNITVTAGTASVSKSQEFYALYCAGQKSLSINTDSFRLGDTYLTSYTDYDTEVIQDGSVSTLIPRAVNVVNSGKELRYTSDISSIDGAAIATLPNGTESIEMDILFPSGLIRYNSDGSESSYDTKISIGRRIVGEPSFTFQTYIPISAQERDGFRIRWKQSGLDVTKQYEYRVQRLKLESENRSNVDKMYLGNVRCFRAATDTINDDYRDALSFVAFKIRATNQLNGPVDNFNLIAQTNIRDYDGSGSGASEWPVAPTSNPASIALYLLTSPEIVKSDYAADSEIDWSSFEEWHNFCDTKGYECNYVVTQAKTLQEILEIVQTCGRAQLVKKEGKYSVIIDQERTAPVQMFTERNSKNWSTTKAYPNIPDAVRVNFIDDSVDFQQAQAIIPKDPDAFSGILNPSYQSADYPGVTNYDQLWSLTRYKIACGLLRSETHSFETDIEHIRCTRGDWVKVQSPAILWGIGPGARVTEVTAGVGTIESLKTDEYYLMEAGKSYALGWRNLDGTMSEAAIDGVLTDSTTNEFTFTTPVAVNLPGVDTLIAFGEVDYVTSDIIVQEIAWGNDGGAIIKGVAYAPDVFTADSGDIPDFDPKLSVPGENTTGAYIGKVPTDEEREIQTLNAISLYNAQTKRSLRAELPDLYRTSTVPAIYFFERGNDSFFVDSTDLVLNNKLIKPVGNGTDVNTAKCGPFCIDENNGLIYTNLSNGYIYLVEDGESGNGAAVNSVESWCPTAGTDRLFYINASDKTIYETTIAAAAGNGSQVATFPVIWIQYVRATNEIFYLKSDGSIYRKSADDSDAGTAVYTGTSSMFSASISGDKIIYIDSDDLGIYEKSIVSDAADDGTPIYSLSSFCYLAETGNVYSTASFDNGYLYLGLKDRAVEEASLSAEQLGYTLSGTLTSGAATITDVATEDLDVIEVNDSVSGTGIPDGSFITVKGPSWFKISENATATGETSLTVSGTRIFLDANRVVVPGTIQARLLSASAINSKARATDGNHKSEFDLDSADIKLRKNDGTVVLDFDADRTGTELQITGTVQSGNYVAGSAGWKIDQDGTAELNEITARGTLQSGNYETGVSGWSIDNDGAAEFESVIIRNMESGDTDPDVYIVADKLRSTKLYIDGLSSFYGDVLSSDNSTITNGNAGESSIYGGRKHARLKGVTETTTDPIWYERKFTYGTLTDMSNGLPINLLGCFYIGNTTLLYGVSYFVRWSSPSIQTDRFYVRAYNYPHDLYGQEYNSTAYDYTLAASTSTTTSDGRTFSVSLSDSPIKSQFLLVYGRATSASGIKIDSIGISDGGVGLPVSTGASIDITPCYYTGSLSVTAGSLIAYV